MGNRQPFFLLLGGAASILALAGTSAVSGQSAGLVRLQSTSPGTTQVGHLHISGTLRAGSLVGSGSGITNLPLSAINVSSATEGQVPTIQGGNLVWADSLGGGLALPYSGTASSEDTLFELTNSSTELYSSAIRGTNSATGATGSIAYSDRGLYGRGPFGVWGESDASGNTGYLGFATAGAGGYSTDADGVYGWTHALFNGAAAVTGLNLETNAKGQLGVDHNGVYGEGNPGVYGQTYVAGSQGVFGMADADGYGVFGFTTAGYAGVFGKGPINGVYGNTANDNASGVYGKNDASGVGVAGLSAAGLGVSGTSGSYHGVFGRTGAGSHYAGVAAFGSGSANGSPGVYATSYDYGTQSFADHGAGVLGECRGTDGGWGVIGQADSSQYGIGVLGQAYGQGSYGVFANGNSGASGTKSFRIDHPLDPAGAYLLHYSSEGPEPVNTYSGNVTTDGQGVAWVTLPDYFESINRDFRYTLTVVDEGDSFVQAKVWRKITGNRFAIRTSAPGTEVSWEVKGVRNDAWVRKYGAPVEIKKTEGEQGRYLQPELYGASPELAIPRLPDSLLRRQSKPGSTKPGRGSVE